MAKITLRVAVLEEGVTVVIPSDWRIKWSLVTLRHQSRETDDPEQKEFLDRQAKEVQSRHEELKQLYPNAEDREFAFEQYTFGQKRKARARYTTMENGRPVLDLESMMLELLQHCLNKSEVEIDAMPSTIVKALLEEMEARCEPDPEKAAFLFSKLIFSEQTQSVN